MTMSDEEFCQRCSGGPDEDLRTLWHSCFYDMAELGLPLKEIRIKGTSHQKTGARYLELLKGVSVSTFADEGEEFSKPFFTLRVCKSCRADWLSVIKEWFIHPPHVRIEDFDVGSGIWIRENGVNKQVTLEEYNKLCYKKQMGQERN